LAGIGGKPVEEPAPCGGVEHGDLVFRPHPRPEPTTPEKGCADHSPELFDTL
jgi:hypothetical protein